MAAIPTPPGFHDFYPEDMLIRQYLNEVWRRVARRYGFVEYEAPVVEMTELYRRKSGEEILSQLFHFTDQGGRDIALRPELTPSLARMVAARPKDYRKPMKWFEIGSCFRGEKPMRGRRREFVQFNADIVGEASPGADAELIALLIDVLRELGFRPEDVKFRLSSRAAWAGFLDRHRIPADQAANVLSLIDKRERDPAGSAAKLATLGLKDEDVAAFIADPENARSALAPVLDDLEARGLADFVVPDLSIVRGLAYYTGTVFEVFDAACTMRAVAGGGRYDNLVGLISGGKTEMPAVGFAMGNIVVLDLIEQCGEARMRLEAWKQHQNSADIYVVVADESRRAEALATARHLRDAGLRVDLPLAAAKFGKQFQAAEAAGASLAVLIGSEYPDIPVKHLASRREIQATPGTLLTTLTDLLSHPTNLIA